jgi:drug/metabolite transporter (DMT)-like permease
MESEEPVNRSKLDELLGRHPVLLGLGALVALWGMAANGILTRLAISQDWSRVFSFAVMRLGSGILGFALVILAVEAVRASRLRVPGTWIGAVTLTGTVVAFSAACAWSEIGMGVLIMFAFVQMTLILAALLHGERLSAAQIAGMAAAVGGLIFLVAPGNTAPSPLGALFMAISGLCWGLYSLNGRRAGNAVANAAGNLLRTAPALLLLLPAAAREPLPSVPGVLCGISCGAVMTGFGYSLWYLVQRHMSGIQASLVQLLVPPFVAVGGIVFLSEPITQRLVLASLLILGGVATSILAGRTGQATTAPGTAGKPAEVVDPVE